MLCDTCNNKAICRVREMRDSVYPGTVIDVPACSRYAGQSAAAPAPVIRARRSIGELAKVSERIKKATKENTENTGTFKCPACGKLIPTEEGVTDIKSGKVFCQSCYDKL